LIGSHPEIQKKLHQEIDAHFGDTSRIHLSDDDFRELNYLDCVIKESLRLLPPVPYIQREFTEDLVIGNLCFFIQILIVFKKSFFSLDGVHIKKGTTCSIWIHNIHRDERYFPQPEKFDPDRFLPENSTDRPPYAYIPFSAGRRNCVGQRYALMELKIIITQILRNFTLKSMKTIEELKLTPDVVLRPLKGEIPLKLTARQ
jgi:docosahexaenoic acid omega-hydroxylase